MKNNRVAILFLIVMSRCALACTQSEENGIGALRQELKLSNRDLDYSLGESDFAPLCKKWSEFDDLSIIAVPYLYPKTPLPDGERHLGVVLAVIKTSTGDFAQKFDDGNVALADQFIVESIKIDTAAFNISNSRLAFGIRFVMSGGSRLTSTRQENLNLYLPDRGKIKKILSSLVVGETSSQQDIGCEESFSEMISTISMSKSLSHDWNDIQISERSSSYEVKNVKGDCKKIYGNKSNKRIVYYYDGLIYKIPNKFRSMTDLDES